MYVTGAWHVHLYYFKAGTVLNVRDANGEKSYGIAVKGVYC
jgi:hypothetical protein